MRPVVFSHYLDLAFRVISYKQPQGRNKMLRTISRVIKRILSIESHDRVAALIKTNSARESRDAMFIPLGHLDVGTLTEVKRRIPSRQTGVTQLSEA